MVMATKVACDVYYSTFHSRLFVNPFPTGQLHIIVGPKQYRHFEAMYNAVILNHFSGHTYPN